MSLSRSQVREVDRLAIEMYGIPSIVLMENAARNAAQFILSRFGESLPIAVVCGSGNNGGDGYAIARHLVNAGRPLEIFETSDPRRLGGDAAVNREIARRMGLQLTAFNCSEVIRAEAIKMGRFGLIIDAVLGTGFSGVVRSPLDEAIHAMNSARVPIVSIDVPSGLDCDTGLPSNATIQAVCTVTFVASKSGFSTAGTDAYTGEIFVADIGAPRELIELVRR